MRRDERGQNLVEMALVVPLLLLLIGGIADLGRAFYTYISLTNATREGARAGARRPWDTDAITAATATELANGGISEDFTVNIECRRWNSSGDGAVVACLGTEGGDYITVSVTYTGFDLLLGAITGVDALTISGRTRMSIQGFNPMS